MSSLALGNNNNNMTPSEILSLNLNDSALDLLNAAIASHQQVQADREQQEADNGNVTTEDESISVSPVTSHAKRELDKDDQVATAPKRAGRKPLDKSLTPDSPLDPKQKRKAQNRAAQRAFRDRKEKHVAELQARIDELEAQNAVKDEDLVEENKKLKEMLQKLQEENYALKGAQFTFEFPVHDSPPQSGSNRAATTSSSSMSSGNSYSSGNEDINSSSMESSPISRTQQEEDSSTQVETPTNLFSSEPLQFGLIQPQQNNDIDFLAIADANNYGLGNGISTSQNFPTSNETNFTNIDLFNGKDDLFTNYRVPTTTTTTNDDFLFANEDLSSLFGGNNDLFGFNNQQFSFNEQQFGLPETRRNTCTKDKRVLMYERLKKGQQEGKYISQITKDLQKDCPDFNLDLLCDEMKRKATCTSHQYPVTDHDINAFAKYLDHA